jgi:hypothetical protein
MSKMMMFAAALVALPAAVHAQQYNAATGQIFAEPPVINTSDASIGYNFGPDRSQQQISRLMRNVRDICALDSRRAQAQCARDKYVLEGAFARFHRRTSER